MDILITCGECHTTREHLQQGKVLLNKLLTDAMTGEIAVFSQEFSTRVGEIVVALRGFLGLGSSASVALVPDPTFVPDPRNLVVNKRYREVVHELPFAPERVIALQQYLDWLLGTKPAQTQIPLPIARQVGLLPRLVQQAEAEFAQAEAQRRQQTHAQLTNLRARQAQLTKDWQEAIPRFANQREVKLKARLQSTQQHIEKLEARIEQLQREEEAAWNCLTRAEHACLQRGDVDLLADKEHERNPRFRDRFGQPYAFCVFPEGPLQQTIGERVKIHTQVHTLWDKLQFSWQAYLAAYKKRRELILPIQERRHQLDQELKREWQAEQRLRHSTEFALENEDKARLTRQYEQPIRELCEQIEKLQVDLSANSVARRREAITLRVLLDHDQLLAFAPSYFSPLGVKAEVLARLHNFVLSLQMACEAFTHPENHIKVAVGYDQKPGVQRTVADMVNEMELALSNLAPLTAWCKIAVSNNGQQHMETHPLAVSLLPKGPPQCFVDLLQADMLAQTHQQYCTPRQQIEAEMRARQARYRQGVSSEPPPTRQGSEEPHHNGVVRQTDQRSFAEERFQSPARRARADQDGKKPEKSAPGEASR